MSVATRRVVGALLFLTLASASGVLAHEGHVHNDGGTAPATPPAPPFASWQVGGLNVGPLFVLVTVVGLVLGLLLYVVSWATRHY